MASSTTGWRRALLPLAALALAASLAVPARAGGADPRPPLRPEGRWLVDATGRVVLLHGVNEVAKAAPFHPSAFGFGADDAAFLAEQGFNAVRLGVDFRGLMPTPGRIERAYLDALAATVRELSRQRIFVLLDFHQDGFSPKYLGNGLPDWMAMDDGLPNPPEPFPLYYLVNPALQRAFESFWANRALPDGVPVQAYYLQGLEAVAKRFRGQQQVFGYELMNEPWPGADWAQCYQGCPGVEQERLAPFYARGTAAIRRWSRRQQVLVEPFVLFNFGLGPTSLPGAGTDNALSVHSYATSVAGEEGVVRQAVEAAERDGAPAIVTEFGASIDPVLLGRLAGQFEEALLSWMMWAYNESIVRDARAPAGLDNVRSLAALAALVRPYPMATAGTPTRTAFDAGTGVFELEYATAGPDGRRRNAPTVVFVPALHYPDGYAVEVTGARVTSRPCAARLLLRAERDAASVAVRVTPGTGCAR